MAYRASERDERLMRDMAAGREAALGEVYDEYGRAVYSLARGILRDGAECEEVAQDVFMQLWRRSASFDPARGNILGFLLAVTRNRCIDRLRRRRSRAHLGGSMPEDDVAVDVRTPFDAAATGDARGRVRSALATLPDVEREVLRLAYFEGLSQSQIAERLETPLGTVKGRARNGLRRLRDALPAELGGVA